LGGAGTPLFCPRRPKAPWHPKAATTSAVARDRTTTMTATAMRAVMATATTVTMVMAMTAEIMTSPPSSPTSVIQLMSDGDNDATVRVTPTSRK
jgi:hypothetical protein